tara:strand:- start:1675 stop:1965 length:291 start_codon:yes stop_codon:yes gene_type:complete
MIKSDLKNIRNLSQREQELLLGNIVTWGAIVTAFTLAILMVPVGTAEGVLSDVSRNMEAVAVQDDLSRGGVFPEAKRADAVTPHGPLNHHLGFANF